MVEVPIYSRIIDGVHKVEEAIIKKYQIDHPPEEAKVDSATLLSARLAWHNVEVFVPDKDEGERDMARDFAYKYSLIIEACELGNWDPMRKYLLEESEGELQEVFGAITPEEKRYSLLAGNAFKRLSDNLTA